MSSEIDVDVLAIAACTSMACKRPGRDSNVNDVSLTGGIVFERGAAGSVGISVTHNSHVAVRTDL